MGDMNWDDLYQKYGGKPVADSKMNFVSKIKEILIKPYDFFEKIKLEPVGESFKFYLILFSIFSILYSILYFGVKNTNQFIIIAKTFAETFIGGLVSVSISILWFHLWIHIFGGKGNLKQTIKSILYGSTPFLLFGWIPTLLVVASNIINSAGLIFGIILELVFSIWALVLSVIGIKKLHGISTSRTILALIVSVITISIIIYLIAITIFAIWLQSILFLL